jgi:hypothetical protein
VRIIVREDETAVSRKSQEQGSAVAYGEIVVQRNKLTKGHQVGTDSETLTAPKHDKYHNTNRFNLRRECSK